ncbi:MAG: leucine-responsive transcriptional regulator [Colwelliaceae bacterium]|nr:leucine-responsive transcriptional regulator [Colwelliaceae bacterium]
MMVVAKSRVLDRIDLTILDTLQKEGRISNVELAKKVNLSASPCLDRVKRLEAEGYIEKYGATLNAAKLKYGMSAFIQVTLDRTTADVFNRFREEVVKIKEVAECHMVAGGFDYLLKLRFENMEAYREVLGVIVELPAVSQTHTYVVMEHVKKDVGVPVIE